MTIPLSQCPFKAGDRVKDTYTNEEGTISSVADEIVFVTTDKGSHFYRNWTHDYFEFAPNSGGGLARLARAGE